MENFKNYNNIKPIYRKEPSKIEGYKIDVVEVLRNLVRFSSVTPDYSDAQKLIAEELSKLGFETVIYECFDEQKPEYLKVYNLLATLGNDKPSFLFCGHSDVVPTGNDWSFEPFGAEIIDGFVCGRGSEDMKSGIAAFLAAVSNFVNQNNNFKGQVAVLISGAEETHSYNGVNVFAKYLKSQDKYFDVCLTGEPTSINQIGDTYKPGRRGNLDFSSKITGDLNAVIPVLAAICNQPLDEGELGFPPSDIVPVGLNFAKRITPNDDLKLLSLKIFGFQGHSAYSHLATNPLTIFLNLVQKLKAEQVDFKILKAFAKLLAVNIIPPTAEAVLGVAAKDYQKVLNILEVFPKIEVMPSAEYPNEEQAEFAINFRFGAKWTFFTLKEEIENRIASVLNGFDANIYNDFLGIADSYVSKGSNFARIYEKVAQDNGIEAKANFGGGTSDTRHIMREGICLEAIDLGVLSRTMHKVDEKTSIEGLKTLTNLYEAILIDFFKG